MSNNSDESLMTIHEYLHNAELMKAKTAKNVAELQNEYNILSKNNDTLVKVIAQNNASRQTIKDLEYRLENAQKSDDEKKVDFQPVIDNLDAKEKEVVSEIETQEKEKIKKDLANKKLQEDKKKLKDQYRKMEYQMRELENQLNNKTAEATKVASRKIILEEEINDLEGKITFEQQHFKLMEEALRFGPPDGSQNENGEQSGKKPEDHQHFLEDILKDYAKQFGDEYEKLMRKHQIREKALLTTRFSKVKKINEEKKAEVDELANKLKKLGVEIIENEKELEKLRKELAVLDEAKYKNQKEYETAKKLKEIQVSKIEKDNEELRNRIEATQKSANQALKVIIELEFEIKTYERLLKLEQENGNLSVLENENDDQTLGHFENDQETMDIPLSEITAQSAGLAGKLPSPNSSSYSSSDDENSNNKSNRSKVSRKSSKKSNSSKP